MHIDMSLKNDVLYYGCGIEEVAGRLNLTTPVETAVGLVGRNIGRIIAAANNRDVCILTGPMAVWSYLVVFHAVVHQFREVRYDDGRGGESVVIARHG